MRPPPQISVVVPCFNEGARIAASLSALHSWIERPFEILVVDDGSRDDTFERASVFSADHPEVRVHRLEPHRGKGAALRAAIPLVAGERVVFLDADLAFDRQSVRSAIDALDAADMVIGNRRHHGSRYSVPVRLFGFLYRRHLVGLTFNLLVRLLLGIRARDTQCGLKAFRREALQQMEASLTTSGFALLLVADALGVRIADVPVQVTYETARSSVKLAQTGGAMALDLLRIAARRAAGRYRPARLRAAASTAAPTRPPR
jgi:glycosyltransferase involved in cell wall biosynthesis